MYCGTLELSLIHIYYKGVGERPKDFDKIWNQGKRKVDEIGFDYELQKVSEPSNIVDFYHLYFYGIGGAKIHAQLIVPKKLTGCLLYTSRCV